MKGFPVSCMICRRVMGTSHIGRHIARHLKGCSVPGCVEEHYSNGMCVNHNGTRNSLAWQKANPDRVNAKNRAWRKANKERVAAQVKARREANRERFREYEQRWAARNKEYTAAKSRRWKDENPERVRENGRRRRAQLRNAYVAPVDTAAIYERDKWICQLCRKPVKRGLVSPDPGSPSIDHILPLVEGGTHEPANVQLAHLGCNRRKQRYVYGNGEQLRLLG